MRSYDSTGAELPNGNFKIPDGEYNLFVADVKEGKSKIKDDGTGGDYQVVCKIKVSDGEHKNFTINYHRVTFFDAKVKPKAAGMSLFFLKCLGQPHEGNFTISPEKWVGHQFKAWLEQKEFNGFKSMQVKWFAPLEESVSQIPVEDDAIPF